MQGPLPWIGGLLDSSRFAVVSAGGTLFCALVTRKRRPRRSILAMRKDRQVGPKLGAAAPLRFGRLTRASDAGVAFSFAFFPLPWPGFTVVPKNAFRPLSRAVNLPPAPSTTTARIAFLRYTRLNAARCRRYGTLCRLPISRSEPDLFRIDHAHEQTLIPN